MTSAFSDEEADRIVSAGSPSHTRKVAFAPAARALSTSAWAWASTWRPLLIDPSQEPATGQSEMVRINDAEHDELGARLDRKRDRVVGGLRGHGREIGREHQPTDRGLVHEPIIETARRSGPVTSGSLRQADQPGRPRDRARRSYYRAVVLEPDLAPVSSTGPVHAALDAAVRGVAGLTSVDDVLQVIVDQVRPVVGARYAALGIVDSSGRIEKFITSGIDQATRERIGPLPEATVSSA